MKRFHRPFFALLISLLLIMSQQAAFAHMLGHLQSEAGATRYQQDDGIQDRLAEVCTSCIAFAGVGGHAPPPAAADFSAACGNDAYRLPLVVDVPTRHARSYHARAPPRFL